jgi:hypothetical protein
MQYLGALKLILRMSKKIKFNVYVLIYYKINMSALPTNLGILHNL